MRPTPGQERLFGDRTQRVARIRRACDAAVTKLRHADRLDNDRPDLIAWARTLAEAGDRENLSAECSGFTLSRLGAEYAAMMDRAAGATVAEHGDPFAIDERFPALRDPAQP